VPLSALFRKPLFWGIFALLSLSCIALATKFVSSAFPVVSVDIRMDRADAIREAGRLSAENGWGPQNPRRAAAFRVDRQVQSFVELGAGGTDAFKRMVEADLYSPYQWQVRLYREGVTNEVLVSFNPKGEAYGFFETIAEEAPGVSLASEEARGVAELGATEWRIDLRQYELIQSSDETRPSGRRDHSFVYERRGIRLGEEGRYRLVLSVAGDELNEARHFIKIPESFTRSYEDLRSANNTISTVAFYLAAGLFGVGGLGFGLFYLLRKRFLSWRRPVVIGAIVAAGLAATQISDIPLAEMGHDTAISRGAFIFQQIASALGSFVGMTVVFSIIFMGAEGLTRVAFPKHLQIWRLWSKGVAGTRQVLGRTLGGYLILGVDFALLVAFYLFARSKLGWYVPSSFPVDPNVLATYVPWLPPIAVSMYAALIEESLFRAVPIASAILLGRRYGKSRLWVVGAFILQALIFGAGHANYEAQPAYARLVELLLPAIFFGLFYYFFGLLPAVLLHFSVDVVFFSLPLFATSADGIWLHRGMVILIALTPLWVALVGVARNRGLNEAPVAEYNSSWTASESRESKEIAAPASKPLTAPISWALIVIGILGLMVEILIDKPRPEIPKLQITSTKARDIATKALEDRGFVPNAGWERLITVYGNPDVSDTFIWRTAGKSRYEGLIGSYLAPPHYRVRFARFTGDLQQRAEEWIIAVNGNGSVRQVTHVVPESAPGKRLLVDAARSIAHADLRERFAVAPERLTEISAVENSKPARTDWSFVFRDPSVDLPQGEVRLRVSISGDEVSDFDRFVHVPEEWARRQRSREAIFETIESLCFGAVLLGFVIGLVMAILGMVRHRFDRSAFMRFFFVMLVISLGGAINSWPALRASLSTAQPVSSQLLVSAGGSILSALVMSAGVALLIGYFTASKSRHKEGGGIEIAAAAGVGIGIAGLLSISMLGRFSQVPVWPDFEPAARLVPLLNLGGIRLFVIATTAVLFVSSLIHESTRAWANRKAMGILISTAAGLVLSGLFGINSLAEWLFTAGTLASILLGVFLALHSRDVSLIPLAIAVYFSIGAVRQASFGAFPGVETSRSIQVIVMLGLALAWSSAFRARLRAPSGEE
jgi:hypothetical protein